MRIAYNQDLTHRNTFRMKVSCACLVEYENLEELKRLFLSGEADSLPAPLFHMGGGSNLLFTGDFKGTVLHSCIEFTEVIGFEGENICKVEAGAGVEWDSFCLWAAERGLWGIENLSAIPGETGAAAVQNIGAYGVEVKDVIETVKCFDTLEKKQVDFDVAECAYGYRDSMFKNRCRGRFIVTSVVFRLRSDASPHLDYGHLKSAVEARREELTPMLVREVVMGIRASKLPSPEVIGSAGSFFKNPVVSKEQYERIAGLQGLPVPHFDLEDGNVKIPAAWMIEQCGWKGYSQGNAGVYEHQPLVIVNLTGNASPEEIISLENRIVESVRDRFGVELHPEVDHI